VSTPRCRVVTEPTPSTPDRALPGDGDVTSG
jgi:hypothetical protein